jgi:hypothetical protein
MVADAGEKVTAVIFYLAVAAAAAYGAWWLWPSGVTDIPVSSLTLGLLLKVGGAVFLGLVAIGALGGVVSAFD